MKDESASLAPSDLTDLATLCKTASEAQKNEMDLELQKKMGRAESVRYWTPIVASLVSTGVLAATLILQMNQFKDSRKQQADAIRQQTEANEDTQWREAIRIMADKPNVVNGAAGVALLKFYLKSERHGDEAKDLALTYLNNMIAPDHFASLLDSMIKGGKFSLDDLVNVNRSLGQTNVQVNGELEKIKKAKADHEKSVSLTDNVTGQLRAWPTGDAEHFEGELFDGVLEEEVATTVRIANRMRENAVRPDVDLSGCAMMDSSFRGINFREADLTDATFWNIDLAGADLSKVAVRSLGEWNETAWWRASNVAPDLLKLLKESYPFPADKQEYLGSTRAEYDKDLARLSTK